MKKREEIEKGDFIFVGRISSEDIDSLYSGVFRVYGVDHGSSRDIRVEEIQPTVLANPTYWIHHRTEVTWLSEADAMAKKAADCSALAEEFQQRAIEAKNRADVAYHAERARAIETVQELMDQYNITCGPCGELS